MLRDELGMRHRRQVPATRQTRKLRLRDAYAQVEPCLFGNRHIALTVHDQRRHANAMELRVEVERLDQVETVCHHALIGLPARQSDKIEKYVELSRRGKQQAE